MEDLYIVIDNNFKIINENIDFINSIIKNTKL